MRKLVDSDIFATEINKKNAVMGKISAIVSRQIPGMVILNDVIIADLKKKILNRKKDRITNEYINAIQQYRMILFTIPPEYRLPDFLPFMTYKRDGEPEVMVNLSNYVMRTEIDSVGSGEKYSYDISNHVNAINIILRTAYLSISTLDPRETLSPDTLYFSAVLWAEMFNKPLYNAFGFHDQQKNDAFMYFAMKFFLIYIMEYPEKNVEGIIRKQIPDKNSLILYMEEQIEAKGLQPFSGLKEFLSTLFNNEVTSMKGIRLNNAGSTKMNISFYLQRFSSLYSSNAFLSLCTYPYFIFVIFSASAKCGIVKDKSFDRLFNDKRVMRDRLLVNLEK